MDEKIQDELEEVIEDVQPEEKAVDEAIPGEEEAVAAPEGAAPRAVARTREGDAAAAVPRDRQRRFKRRRKICAFCVEKARVVDYKEVPKLRRFLTERGKIMPRRQTGTCARHQRMLATAIRRARECALLPFVAQ